MSSRPAPALLGVVGLLAVCCCCISTGSFGIVASVLGLRSGPAASDAPSSFFRSTGGISPSPTRGPSAPRPASATAIPDVATPTPASLNILNRATPAGPLPTVLRAEAYNIVVPTPSAPSLVYPIQFDSTLKTMMYQITGATIPEISRALDTNAIPDPHEANARYYAQTDWHLTAHWYWQQTLRGCEVDRGDVTLAMTVTVPILSALNASQDVQNRWSAFIENTITHESGHVKLDLDRAREYQRALGNYPPARDCGSLQAGLRNLFNTSFAGIDRANVDYDSQTQHGRTQGAVFP